MKWTKHSQLDKYKYEWITQSVIYGGDVCSNSLQFCIGRHVLDINSLMTMMICAVFEQTCLHKYHSRFHFLCHVLVKARTKIVTVKGGVIAPTWYWLSSLFWYLKVRKAVLVGCTGGIRSSIVTKRRGGQFWWKPEKSRQSHRLRQLVYHLTAEQWKRVTEFAKK